MKAFFEELIYLGEMNERFTDVDNTCKSGRTEHREKNLNEINKTKILDHCKYLKARHFKVEKLIGETTALLEGIN